MIGMKGMPSNNLWLSSTHRWSNAENMDQPLRSNDHMQGVDESGSTDARDAEESGGSYFSCFGLSWSPRSGRIRHAAVEDSLAARCGLLAVWEIQTEDLARVFRNGIIVTTIFLLACYFWLSLSDDWSFTNTMYFLAISLLTIGYGDVVVKNNFPDRVVDSVIILLGLGMLAWWGNYASQAAANLRFKRVNGDNPPEFDFDLSVKQARRSLIIRLLLFAIIIAVGTVGFMYGADKAWSTSLYWAVVTSSTVGYGDVVPKTMGMKWFTILYSIISTALMLEALRHVGSYPFRMWNLRADAKVLKQFARPTSLEERAHVGALAVTAVAEVLKIPAQERQGGISRSDFTLAMLLMLDRVSYNDYQQAAVVFDQLQLDEARPLPVPVTISGTPALK